MATLLLCHLRAIGFLVALVTQPRYCFQCWIILCLWLWTTSLAWGQPQLVKDINAPVYPASAEGWIPLNGTIFFVASDKTHGRELWKSDATAAGSSLVKDVYAGTGSSSPGLFTYNETLYFVANDGIHGQELWTSDGTPSGTVLVKDINPGAGGSEANQFKEVNGILYFSAEDGTHGRELWQSDGTAAGTSLVKDGYAGKESSSPYGFTIVNETLFFLTSDSTHGTELWQSNGTEAGTTLVKYLNPGVGYTSPLLFIFKGSLFFVATDNMHGYELWKSDGTEAAAVLVKDVNAGGESSSPYGFTIINGMLYFVANDGIHGQELWTSDGTPSGTVLVKDINPGTGGSEANQFTESNGTLFFVASDSTHGVELWKSNGTEAGTSLVKDIFPGTGLEVDYDTDQRTPFVNSSTPKSLASINGTLYFAASQSYNEYSYDSRYRSNDGYELWKSDGTEAGTVMVKEIYPGYERCCTDYGSDPNGFISYQGLVYFAARDQNGRELWQTDGTEAGTKLVKDMYPGTYSGNYNEFGNNSSPADFTIVNGRLLFMTSNDLDGNYINEDRWWQSDGTEAGTSLMKDVDAGNASSGVFTVMGTNRPSLFFVPTDGSEVGTVAIPVPDSILGSSGSDPQDLHNLNGTLYFSANTSPTAYYNNQLWKSDGTEAGTVLLKPISSQSAISIDSTLYFIAADTLARWGLWKRDGTSAGTVLVKPFSGLSSLMNLNGMLYFLANDGVHGGDLWKSDGTAAGTVMVKDIGPAENSSLNGLRNVNGTLFFWVSYDTNPEPQLWKSDGTEAGTVLVRTFHPQTFSNRLSELTNENGTIELAADDGTFYFTADDGTGFQELWKSDGTEAGTVLVKSIPSEQLTKVNGTIYFTGYDASHGYELWKTDGTSTGTVLVKDIIPGSDGSYPQYMINVNGTLYFAAQDRLHGKELWKTDGTAAGTVLVKDINPGINWSDPSSSYDFNMYVLNQTLYLTANDGEHGDELWRSDGTEAGTQLVADINHGPAGASPSWKTSISGTLYFAADDGLHGRELWQYDPLACKATFSQPVTGSTVCLGSDATLSIANSQVGVRYRAYLDNGDLDKSAVGTALPGNGDTLLLTIPAVSLSVGNYQFRLEASGCPLPHPATVVVQPLVSAPSVSGVSIGSGEVATLLASGAPVGSSYRWYRQPTGGIVLDTTASFTTPALTASTTYYVSVFSACESARTAVAVTVTGGPPACTATGSILQEVWSGVVGSRVSSIPLTTTPSSSSQLTSFEVPANAGDDYGQRLRGYLCAPNSGQYRFWLASDNDGELWLSSDEDPANKQLIAYVRHGWVRPHQWEKYPTQRSTPITLVAGQRYYVEALSKEAGGGDNLSVAWATSPTATPEVIPGSVLSPFVPSTATARQAVGVEGQADTGLFLLVHPNPFSDRTKVSFTSNRSETAVLELYDLRGMRLREVFLGAVLAEEAVTVEVVATGLAQGLYLLRLKTPSQATHQRLLLQR